MQYMCFAILPVTLKFYTHPYGHFHSEWLAVAHNWNSNECWRWSEQNSQNQQAFNQDVLNIDVIWSNKEIHYR